MPNCWITFCCRQFYFVQEISKSINPTILFLTSVFLGEHLFSRDFPCFLREYGVFISFLVFVMHNGGPEALECIFFLHQGNVVKFVHLCNFWMWFTLSPFLCETWWSNVGHSKQFHIPDQLSSNILLRFYLFAQNRTRI